MLSQRTQVALRPFTEKDFEPTAALFAAQWCSWLPAEAARLASQIDLCSYLAATDWSLLAKHAQTGELLGATLLHLGGTPHERWLARKEELLAEAATNPSLLDAVMSDVNLIDEESSLSAEYASSGRAGNEAEVKLLIVSPKAQGLGIGGRLFGGARAQVAESGRHGFFLITDDTCDVSFYEHKRMSRMVTRAFSQAPSDEPDSNDLNMYVYAQELG